MNKKISVVAILIVSFMSMLAIYGEFFRNFCENPVETLVEEKAFVPETGLRRNSSYCPGCYDSENIQKHPAFIALPVDLQNMMITGERAICDNRVGFKGAIRSEEFCMLWKKYPDLSAFVVSNITCGCGLFQEPRNEVIYCASCDTEACDDYCGLGSNTLEFLSSL